MTRYAYVTEIYCEHPDCNDRQCEIYTKELDQPDVKRWQCPACGRPAKVHWRRDAPDHHRITLAESLGRINAALYRRDKKSDDFPIGALALSELPDSWKHVAPPPKEK